MEYLHGHIHTAAKFIAAVG